MPTDEARLEGLRIARLERQRARDVDALVAEQIGLHSTDYATPYLSTWSRVDEHDAGTLYRRVSSGDGLFRVNAFRGTVHLVRAEDLPMVLAACGPLVESTGRRSPGLKGLSDAEIDRGLAAMTDALAGDARTSNELKAALPELGPDLRSWMLVAMGRGVVIRADGAHARSNRTRSRRTTDVLPGFAPGALDAAAARRDVLIRAVRAFGPVTVDDLAWWLPAPKREVTAALASCADLESLTVGRVVYWTHGSLQPSGADRASLGAWALPYEDALLKGYKDRSWLLAPGLDDVVFPYSVSHWSPPDGVAPGPGPHRGVNVCGEARPTLWWAGRVVGRWEERDGGVAWQLHADVGSEGLTAVQACVADLERHLADDLRPLFTASGAVG